MQGADGLGAGPLSQASSRARNARSSGDSMSSWVSSRWASPSIPLSRESKASAGWPAVDRAAADTASARSRSLAVRPSASCSFPAATAACCGSRTGSASISSRSSRTRVMIGPAISSIAPESRALLYRPVSGSRWKATTCDSEIRPTRESPQRRAWSRKENGWSLARVTSQRDSLPSSTAASSRSTPHRQRDATRRRASRAASSRLKSGPSAARTASG